MKPVISINFFEPPHFADEETQRVAKVIYGLSISIGIATLIGVMGVLFVFEEKLISSIALGILFSMGLIAYLLSRKGYIRASSIILLVTLWLTTLGLVSVSGGMRSLDIGFFVTGTAVAGLLLGQRGAFYYGWASILAGTTLLILEAAGMTLPNLFPFPGQTGLILLVINLALLIPALNTTLNTLHDAIRQAHTRLDEQKKIQEELRLSEEKFSKAFHASPMAIIIQRVRDLKYVDINEGFTRITGYTREEALEHTINELNLYPDKEISARMRLQLRAQGFVRDFEIPFRRKSGDIGYGLVWGEPIEVNGEAMYIAGTIDITERKQLELLQKEQAQDISLLYNALSKITGKYDDVKSLVNKIAEIIVNDFQAYECGVSLLSDDHSVAVCKAYCGPEIIEEENIISMMEPGLVVSAVKNKESIYAPDIRTDPRYRMVDEKTLSEYVVPLQAYGEVIGYINMESPKLDDFSERTRRLVLAFAQNASLAILNTKLLNSLETSFANLKESQARINFFLEHTAEGVYRIDYDPPIPITLPIEDQFRLSVERGRIAECNDAIARMYGFAGREEMLGKPYIDFYGEEGYEANLEGNLQFYRDGYRSDEMETVEYNTAGERVYFSNNVIGIIKNNYFVSTWGTQRDITPLKKALTVKEKLNQELEKSLGELKEAQARFNFFIEHTSEGVYRVDYNPPIPINLPLEEQFRLSRERGKFGEANLAIAKMYGYSTREEMLAAPYYANEEGYEASLKANLEFYRNGYKSDDHETEEYTPSGEKAYFLNNAVGIIRDGYFMSIWGTQRDITPLKKAIAELEKRNAELERFTYTLWHELKSPLVTIRGFLGYLEDNIKSQKWNRVQSDIIRISQAAEKMNTLIVNLLDVLRAGHVMNITEPIAFQEIINKGIESLQKTIDDQKIQLEIGTEFPMVRGDRERLAEVVEALVENAIKYMGDQANPHITIGVNVENDRQVFFVRDNGMGIDPLYQERIFNIFEKLNPLSEGTGIGLPLARRIIEIHGGRIWVESQGIGKGSTFYFTLPPK